MMGVCVGERIPPYPTRAAASGVHISSLARCKYVRMIVGWRGEFHEVIIIDSRSRTFEVGVGTPNKPEKKKHPSDRDGLMPFPIQDKWAEVLNWPAQEWSSALVPGPDRPNPTKQVWGDLARSRWFHIGHAQTHTGGRITTEH